MRTQIIPGISLHYFIKQKHRRRTNTVKYRTHSTQADLVGGGGGVSGCIWGFLSLPMPPPSPTLRIYLPQYQRGLGSFVCVLCQVSSSNRLWITSFINNFVYKLFLFTSVCLNMTFVHSPPPPKKKKKKFFFSQFYCHKI